MFDLRDKIIRLAYSKPEFREDLLPLLKESARKPAFEAFPTFVEITQKGASAVLPSKYAGVIKDVSRHMPKPTARVDSYVAPHTQEGQKLSRKYGENYGDIYRAAQVILAVATAWAAKRDGADKVVQKVTKKWAQRLVAGWAWGTPTPLAKQINKWLRASTPMSESDFLGFAKDGTNDGMVW